RPMFIIPPSCRLPLRAHDPDRPVQANTRGSLVRRQRFANCAHDWLPYLGRGLANDVGRWSHPECEVHRLIEIRSFAEDKGCAQWGDLDGGKTRSRENGTDPRVISERKWTRSVRRRRRRKGDMLCHSGERHKNPWVVRELLPADKCQTTSRSKGS